MWDAVEETRKLREMSLCVSKSCLVGFYRVFLCVSNPNRVYGEAQQGLLVWFSDCIAFLVWIKIPSEMGVLSSVISQTGQSMAETITQDLRSKQNTTYTSQNVSVVT